MQLRKDAKMQQLRREAASRRGQLDDAKKLQARAQERERRIEQRLKDLRTGGGASSASGRRAAGPPKALPSVEEELERMKRDMRRK